MKRIGLVVLASFWATLAHTAERTQSFDRDPGWDGHNHRSAVPRPIKQDFGYSRTAHAGRAAGEVGGFITPAAEPAYYAKKIPTLTFDDRFSASGTLACTGRQFNCLIGFFNADTINEWRTPNSLVLRIYGRGDVFYAYVEYATARWRAGGDSPGGFANVQDPKTGKSNLRGFATKGVRHTWSLRYDPQGNGGAGAITVKLDGESAVCHLNPGHKADGATFNRFGLINVIKHPDDGGEVWLDDVTINGAKETFDQDPGWEGKDNRRTYDTRDVRPRFDFGFSPTHFAGGKASGELGGLTYRGDCRYPEKLAAYGDRLDPLTLTKPLKARGKVTLRRGVSDSTTLFGFYHSADSLASNPSQSNGFPRSFVGAAIEGPSSEGFYFYPVYRTSGDASGHGSRNDPPRILPDGKVHDWTLDYDPSAAGGKGRITVALDGQAVTLDLDPDAKKAGTTYDRFGLVTTWIDGNGQRVYFDDLRYTWRQE